MLHAMGGFNGKETGFFFNINFWINFTYMTSSCHLPVKETFAFKETIRITPLSWQLYPNVNVILLVTLRRLFSHTPHKTDATDSDASRL